jgi:hypothetical protein
MARRLPCIEAICYATTLPHHPHHHRFASRIQSERIAGPLHHLPLSSHKISPHHAVPVCEIGAGSGDTVGAGDRRRSDEMNGVVGHALTRLCGPGARFDGSALLGLFGECWRGGYSKNGLLLWDVWGLGLNGWINLDGIVAHVGIPILRCSRAQLVQGAIYCSYPPHGKDWVRKVQEGKVMGFLSSQSKSPIPSRLHHLHNLLSPSF